MQPSTIARGAAAFSACALMVTIPATASAQPTGSIDPNSLEGAVNSAEMFPGSVAALAGGGLASVGSGDLGSAVAGGQCVGLDPSLGSIATSVDVQVATKEGESGVAAVSIEGGSWFTNTSGTFHWTNTTTNETGEVPFGPFGGDAPFADFDVPTGVGTVTWRVEGSAEGFPLSVLFPLIIIGSVNPVPMSSAPYSTCEGQAEIA